LILANADIYFDYTLEFFYEKLLSETSQTSTAYQIKAFPPKTLISLLKWASPLNTASRNQSSAAPPDSSMISISLRTDSQDVWIFEPTVPETVIAMSDFAMGLPRCDNRLIEIFHHHNYTIVNAPFHLHSIEIQRDSRLMNAFQNSDNSQSNYVNSLYGMKNAVAGEGRNVFLSDFFSL
jgi:hypothetical protein